MDTLNTVSRESERWMKSQANLI